MQELNSPTRSVNLACRNGLLVTWPKKCLSRPDSRLRPNLVLGCRLEPKRTTTRVDLCHWPLSARDKPTHLKKATSSYVLYTHTLTHKEHELAWLDRPESKARAELKIFGRTKVLLGWDKKIRIIFTWVNLKFWLAS